MPEREPKDHRVVSESLIGGQTPAGEQNVIITGPMDVENPNDPDGFVQQSESPERPYIPTLGKHLPNGDRVPWW